MNSVTSRKRGEMSRKSLRREQASPQGIQARTPTTNPSRAQMLWAASFAALLIGLYLRAGFGLWFVAGGLAALLFLGVRQERMRAVDGALLLIAGLEIPSLLSSQYVANSIRATAVILIGVLAFLCVRLTFRHAAQTAWFSAVLALVAVWLSISGIWQFNNLQTSGGNAAAYHPSTAAGVLRPISNPAMIVRTYQCMYLRTHRLPWC